MSNLLLDTNAASILYRPVHPLFNVCAAMVREQQLFVSFMTRAELLSWSSLNSWGPRRTDQLNRHIELFTTLYPDADTCARWVEVRLRCRRAGRPIGVADAWIAATALQWEMSLVTADVRDFESVPDLHVVAVV